MRDIKTRYKMKLLVRLHDQELYLILRQVIMIFEVVSTAGNRLLTVSKRVFS
jgi:hypothetical protein